MKRNCYSNVFWNQYACAAVEVVFIASLEIRTIFVSLPEASYNMESNFVKTSIPISYFRLPISDVVAISLKGDQQQQNSEGNNPPLLFAFDKAQAFFSCAAMTFLKL